MEKQKDENLQKDEGEKVAPCENHLGLLPAAAAKSLQSCLTLWSHRWQPPGSPIPGILQARTLEWVAISFSNAWKWKVKGKLLSRVRLLATPWTAAYQAPLSMRFSRQSTGVGCHCLLCCYLACQRGAPTYRPGAGIQEAWLQGSTETNATFFWQSWVFSGSPL